MKQYKEGSILIVCLILIATTTLLMVNGFHTHGLLALWNGRRLQSKTHESILEGAMLYAIGVAKNQFEIITQEGNSYQYEFALDGVQGDTLAIDLQGADRQIDIQATLYAHQAVVAKQGCTLVEIAPKKLIIQGFQT